jgi:hypothetical protein
VTKQRQDSINIKKAQETFNKFPSPLINRCVIISAVTAPILKEQSKPSLAQGLQTFASWLIADGSTLGLFSSSVLGRLWYPRGRRESSCCSMTSSASGMPASSGRFSRWLTCCCRCHPTDRHAVHQLVPSLVMSKLKICRKQIRRCEFQPAKPVSSSKRGKKLTCNNPTPTTTPKSAPAVP